MCGAVIMGPQITGKHPGPVYPLCIMKVDESDVLVNVL